VVVEDSEDPFLNAQQRGPDRTGFRHDQSDVRVCLNRRTGMERIAKTTTIAGATDTARDRDLIGASRKLLKETSRYSCARNRGSRAGNSSGP
jgi:hypothetical protein